MVQQYTILKSSHCILQDCLHLQVYSDEYGYQNLKFV